MVGRGSVISDDSLRGVDTVREFRAVEWTRFVNSDFSLSGKVVLSSREVVNLRSVMQLENLKGCSYQKNAIG